MYNKIVNPKTGRKVSIYGKLGQQILNNYLQYGGTSCRDFNSKDECERSSGTNLISKGTHSCMWLYPNLGCADGDCIKPSPKGPPCRKKTRNRLLTLSKRQMTKEDRVMKRALLAASTKKEKLVIERLQLIGEIAGWYAYFDYREVWEINDNDYNYADRLFDDDGRWRLEVAQILKKKPEEVTDIELYREWKRKVQWNIYKRDEEEASIGSRLIKKFPILSDVLDWYYDRKDKKEKRKAETIKIWEDKKQRIKDNMKATAEEQRLEGVLRGMVSAYNR